jgi:nitroreductase
LEQDGISTELNKKDMVTRNANADYPISELIAKRWSARAFSTRPVEKSKLLSVLEAARWAPSSRNEQPWRYIVFTNDNPEMLQKAQSVLKEINDYAKRAPILICAITKKRILRMEVRTGFIFMI